MIGVGRFVPMSVVVTLGLLGPACGTTGSPGAHGERTSEARLLDGSTFELQPLNRGSVDAADVLPPNLPVNALTSAADLVFTGTFVGFATEPNAVREVEDNLPKDFPNGPWILAIFDPVRVKASDGSLQALETPIAVTVGLGAGAVDAVDPARIVSSLDELPEVGKEYLFAGPMLSDLPERCVDTTEAFPGNGLFAVIGGDVIDRSGDLVSLESLTVRHYVEPDQPDPAIIFAGRPSEEISANVSRFESASSDIASEELRRSPIVAKRCSDAAKDIGGPYTTRADILKALSVE